jgi:hypothetical protein
MLTYKSAIDFYNSYICNDDTDLIMNKNNVRTYNEAFPRSCGPAVLNPSPHKIHLQMQTNISILPCLQ